MTRPRTTPAAPDVPRASSPTARKVMQGNRPDSAVERELRRELHLRGRRFRKHLAVVPSLRCRPDIVFTRARVAVFVDGCFWHSCPEHGTHPKGNHEWWKAKLAANATRDRRNDEALTAAGWTVLRLWEHESIDAMAKQVIDAVDLSYAR